MLFMESLITDMIARERSCHIIINIKNAKRSTWHRPAGSMDSYTSFASIITF